MTYRERIDEHNRILQEHPEITVNARWGLRIEYSIRLTRTDVERLMSTKTPDRQDLVYRLSVGSEWTDGNQFVRNYARVEYRVGSNPWREPKDASAQPGFMLAERYLRSRCPAVLDLMELDAVIQTLF